MIFYLNFIIEHNFIFVYVRLERKNRDNKLYTQQYWKYEEDKTQSNINCLEAQEQSNLRYFFELRSEH